MTTTAMLLFAIVAWSHFIEALHNGSDCAAYQDHSSTHFLLVKYCRQGNFSSVETMKRPWRSTIRALSAHHPLNKRVRQGWMSKGAGLAVRSTIFGSEKVGRNGRLRDVERRCTMHDSSSTMLHDVTIFQLENN